MLQRERGPIPFQSSHRRDRRVLGRDTRSGAGFRRRRAASESRSRRGGGASTPARGVPLHRTGFAIRRHGLRALQDVSRFQTDSGRVRGGLRRPSGSRPARRHVLGRGGQRNAVCATRYLLPPDRVDEALAVMGRRTGRRDGAQPRRIRRRTIGGRTVASRRHSAGRRTRSPNPGTRVRRRDGGGARAPRRGRG